MKRPINLPLIYQLILFAFMFVFSISGQAQDLVEYSRSTPKLSTQSKIENKTLSQPEKDFPIPSPLIENLKVQSDVPGERAYQTPEKTVQLSLENTRVLQAKSVMTLQKPKLAVQRKQ